MPPAQKSASEVVNRTRTTTPEAGARQEPGASKPEAGPAGTPATSTSSPARRRTPASRPKGMTDSPEPNPLTILMISPEAVPFAKTGGLADVAGALPLALARLGHDVTLVLPRYRRVPSFQE